MTTKIEAAARELRARTGMSLSSIKEILSRHFGESEAALPMPVLIIGDGRKQLPRNHHIAENVPGELGEPYSNFVGLGEATIKGRVYLDYGIPDFSAAEAHVRAVAEGGTGK